MGQEDVNKRREGRERDAGAPEGGRSPTGGAPENEDFNGNGPLEPGQRWTVARKREIVLRVMRGESIESLSRELGVESYRIQDWYDRAMAGMEVGLRVRGGGDPLELQLKRAQAMVGELTMMNELLQEKQRRLEHPFDRKRSRK